MIPSGPGCLTSIVVGGKPDYVPGKVLAVGDETLPYNFGQICIGPLNGSKPNLTMKTSIETLPAQKRECANENCRKPLLASGRLLENVEAHCGCEVEDVFVSPCGYIYCSRKCWAQYTED